MPCTAVTGHIDIPMPCRRTEVPFKIQRIDLLLCSETQVQWGHYSCFWIFITAYGTVGRIGRFPGVINKIICLDDIVPICIIAVCDVLIKIVTLRNKPLFCRIADYIGYRTISIFLDVFGKIVRKECCLPRFIKARKAKLRTLFETVT